MQNKITFSIRDLITVTKVIPERGNYIEALLIDSIRKKVMMSPEVIKKCNIRSTTLEDGRVTTSWDQDSDYTKDITFEDAEIELMKKKIDKLDKAGDIMPEDLELIKKIKELNSEAEN